MELMLGGVKNRRRLATGVLGLSAVVAMLPVVGVMAESSKTETVTVTVNQACTFTRTSGTATKSLTMAVNALDTSATSTFQAVCNNAGGFSVGATFTSITGTGAAITYSATTPTAGSGTWTAAKGAASSTTNIAASSGTLMTASGVTSGTSQQVTYKVGTRNNQAKGSYSGTATYQLTQN